MEKILIKEELVMDSKTTRTSYPVATSGGRILVINRSTTQTGSSPNRIKMDRSAEYNSMSGLPIGSYSSLTSSGVTSVKESHDQEKKDMRDLNDRFSSYIDKVRYLESQNRHLADDLDKLKTKWGRETMQVKVMFQTELDEARRNLNEAETEKGRLEIRATSLDDEVDELKQQ